MDSLRHAHALKKRLLKNATIGIFQKGLTHDFCQKFNIFSLFFVKINLEKVFANVMDR